MLDDKPIGSVMVVGGGISGIQAAIELAGSGLKVFLVEKGPAIGGHMAQLDKTFPTNDCSMCILSPKIIECSRNPNIEIMTLSELENVTGQAGHFHATIFQKPRYIDLVRCTGCGECPDWCPVKVNDPFNENLSLHKAINIPFPQAAPAAAIIEEQCPYLLRRECGVCAPQCKAKAIDFEQKAKRVDIEVGAFILAPGYDPFPAGCKGEYSYGRMANVITSLEFERMLSSFGPFQGKVLRPSDQRPAKRIAWIQCVGSRDALCGNTYCSAVCCTQAVKQVILSKELDKETRATVFYNDMRTFGKGFEQYFESAKKLPGVDFVRCIVSTIKERQQTRNLVIRYVAPEGAIRDEEFDLVVLSVGLKPAISSRNLAQTLGVELNSHGFARTSDFAPVATCQPGVFVAGTFRQPMDIPDSVVTATAAAGNAARLLSGARGTLVTAKEYTKERTVVQQRPRIGVFICRCGSNIANTINTAALARYARNLEGVIHAEEQVFGCSNDATMQMIKMIKQKSLNRVVVAACSPRTHEPLFQEMLSEAGLNRYLVTMANIREHCSWVHADNKDGANEKAKDLLKMAIARARLLRPLRQVSSPVAPGALVVGGGISGMTAALELADQGFQVHLVERRPHLGGTGSRIYWTLGGEDVRARVSQLIERVESHPLIDAYTGAAIIGSSGHVGEYVTSIEQGKDMGIASISHGVTILATGGEEYRPTEYLFGEDPRVLTLLELEKEIAESSPRIVEAQSAAIIHCVGSRNADRPYCSRTCCGQSVKCAIRLKRANPGMSVYVFYRDMRTYAFQEDQYLEARKLGVMFLRYEAEHSPKVEATTDNGRNVLRMTVIDSVLGRDVTVLVDLLGLAVATIPSTDARAMSQMFKIPLTSDGFLLEAHAKLRPVDSSGRGVFLCGLAHAPKPIDESISQAQAAAARAAQILASDSLDAEPTIASMSAAECIGCRLCESLCPFGAVTVVTRDGRNVAQSVPAACTGCGICAARCPTRAISLDHFSDTQITSEIMALSGS